MKTNNQPLSTSVSNKIWPGKWKRKSVLTMAMWSVRTMLQLGKSTGLEEGCAGGQGPHWTVAPDWWWWRRQRGAVVSKQYSFIFCPLNCLQFVQGWWGLMYWHLQSCVVSRLQYKKLRRNSETGWIGALVYLQISEKSFIWQVRNVWFYQLCVGMLIIVVLNYNILRWSYVILLEEGIICSVSSEWCTNVELCLSCKMKE